MKKYILTIDQGTTGTTALLIDSKSLEIISQNNREFKQYFPKPGQVEHDLNDIYESIEKTVSTVLKNSGVDGKDIISIAITNQRETTCAYQIDGTPLAKAIVWQDRRTSKYCQDNQDKYTLLKKKTGLPLDPYFSATKMRWLLDNDAQVREAFKNDNLHLSTIDSFILYKLTDGSSFLTEASNASRTLLMDLETTDWDEELLKFFDIPKKVLPKISESFTDFGVTKNLNFLPDGIPIHSILGDQQAALFGQNCVLPGQIKCTYGTGAFLLANTGDEIIHSRNGLLTTVAYKTKNHVAYAIEGSTYIAGAAVQWLRDGLQIIKSSSDIEKLALKSKNKNTEELFFFPFFSGVGAPYWKADVKGSIVGLTRGTSKADIAKSCLEGIAQSVSDSIEAIEKDFGKKLESIKVDGGASQNNLLLELQSNFSNKKIERPQNVETTAFGVALGAYLFIGNLKVEDLKGFNKKDKEFHPKQNEYFLNKRKEWIKKVKSF